MNKFFLIFLVFSSPLFSISDYYKELRTHFKKQMYFAQAGLMKEAEYNAFIDPYLQEIEKTSKVIQYCMESHDSGLCCQYMTRLHIYNIICFHNTVKSTQESKSALECRAEDLIELIEAIKAEGDLKDLDVQQEFKKTSDLIHRANKDYYKKLNFGTKIFLWFGSNMVAPIVRSFV